MDRLPLRSGSRPGLSQPGTLVRLLFDGNPLKNPDKARVYLDPRASPTNPATAATTPPTSIHIALSVGEPVKNRETSEPNEFDALTPNTISKMPPASSARESGLFMFYLLRVELRRSKKITFGFIPVPHELCTMLSLTRPRDAVAIGKKGRLPHFGVIVACE